MDISIYIFCFRSISVLFQSNSIFFQCTYNLILTLMSFFFFRLLRLLHDRMRKPKMLLYEMRENNLRFKWSGKIGLIESSLIFHCTQKIARNKTKFPEPNEKKSEKICSKWFRFDLVIGFFVGYCYFSGGN